MRPRRLRLCVLSILPLLGAGCAHDVGLPDRIYLHDEALAASAKDARTRWNEATTDVWEVLLANYEKGAAAERESFARVLALTFEGQLQGIDSKNDPLTWRDIERCATGHCLETGDIDIGRLEIDWSHADASAVAGIYGEDSTEAKIAATLKEIGAIGEEIEKLRGLIASDPLGKEAVADVPSLPGASPTCPLTDTVRTSLSRIALLKAEVDCTVGALDGRIAAARAQLLDEVDDVLLEVSAQVSEPRAGLRTPTTTADRIEAGLRDAAGDARDAVEDAKSLGGALVALRESVIGAIDEAIDESEQAGEVSQDAGDELLEAITFVAEPIFAKAVPAPTDLPGMNGVLRAADRVLEDAEERVVEALGGDSGLDQVLEILRKSEHLELLRFEPLAALLGGSRDATLEADEQSRLSNAFGQAFSTVGNLLDFGDDERGELTRLLETVSVGDLLGRLRERPLSSELQTALQDNTGRALADVGALIDYLATNESKLQEVRLSLVRDWRKAVVEERALQLSQMEQRLQLQQNLLTALRRQRIAEDGIAAAVARYDGEYADGNTSFLDAEVFQSLDGHAAASRRSAFEDGAGILGRYFERIGHLREAEVLALIEIASYEHRASIEESQFGARAREQLISRGLEGLVAFTEGGITNEEIAAVLELLQTGILAGIAGS